VVPHLGAMSDAVSRLNAVLEGRYAALVTRTYAGVRAAVVLEGWPRGELHRALGILAEHDVYSTDVEIELAPDGLPHTDFTHGPRVPGKTPPPVGGKTETPVLQPMMRVASPRSSE
jgi:hypothetical protein